MRGGSSDNIAEVWIYKGTFGTKGAGQDGFNVYDYSTVYFGAHTESELNGLGYSQNLINIYANYFPIAVNPLSDGNNKVQVYVYYGHYEVANIRDVNGNVTTRGIGSIDDTMTDVTFRIYGFGNNVFHQTDYNHAPYSIRFNKTDVPADIIRSRENENRYFPYIT